MKGVIDTEYRVTQKGLAVSAAIESGMCKKVDGGYDTSEFERFWSLYELKQARKDADDRSKMLCNYAECKSKKRKKYVKYTIEFFVAFFIGLFFNALFIG